MNNELKGIKKKYGEKFSHLCRDIFSTILEENGLLLEILDNHFADNHFLYDDIVESNLLNSFTNYIYGLYYEIKNTDLSSKLILETPEELMDRTGYILKECKTEEEIQEYKKYYTEKESLCTFRSNRLKIARVFFAVKKNVDEIKRENFTNPDRQDEYGTSVISIQFYKDGNNTLSIKNRYNHTVMNPNATFSNNLDNIINGLTKSFEMKYNIIQTSQREKLKLKNYIKANDGKYYKYNYKINNIYYCSNNIIIDNFEVIKYDKEKYIVMDYYILDLVNGTINLYDNRVNDSFINCFGTNKLKIDINCLNNLKLITINNSIFVVLNDKNQIIAYENINVRTILKSFMRFNNTLQLISLPNVISIENDFLINNEVLKTCLCPNLLNIDFNFLFKSQSLNEFLAPKLDEYNKGYLSYPIIDLLEGNKQKVLMR